jgi:hypothetical protein
MSEAQTPTLAAVLADLLSWEAEAFDDDTPIDLADLCTRFGVWRTEIKAALALNPVSPGVVIGIRVDGGIIQSIFTPTPLPAIEVVVFDGDVEGDSEDVYCLDGDARDLAFVTVYDLGDPSNTAPIPTFEPAEAEGE